MKPYVQQSQPGPCVSCQGAGWVDVETFYGLEGEEETEDCSLCNGTGHLSEADLRELGWMGEPHSGSAVRLAPPARTI